MEIIFPFSSGPGQLKFIFMEVKYFTKWIEVDALSKITPTNILKFFKRSILARYGIPQYVISDNGTQFTNKHLKKLFDDLKVKHFFTSVEDPRTNRQAEVAIRFY